jgi:hypothetical protein
MTKPEDVVVETIVKVVEEKAPEVVAVVKEVEEVLAKQSCSCIVFGWDILIRKSVKTDSKE